MVRENCRARPAVVVLKQRMGDGRESSLGLCNHCASAMGMNAAVGYLEGLLGQMMGSRTKRESILTQLSERAQQVLEHAARLTLQWGYERIRVEHLLLALSQKVPEIRSALEAEGTEVDEYE